ncbi:FAD-dependent oxidoreductase [bacterium]|nr:FAD-dependent oxidoreductase [Rubripirellula sp.]MDB4339141.1 FAD-dependent oxidoreductase [Rubripirellula sp.]MDB4809795.1 FAD-dependent oxidoreductase [bacterium]MDC0295228.1 FAD-dependent oxidoreductase [bacterium]
MNENPIHDGPFTLDPPGTIAVVGAGPLGIEASLYGRFLGYKVTIIESNEVGGILNQDPTLPLPMLPDRCLSNLALQAIRTQKQEESEEILPLTLGDWVNRYLIPLTQTDLLRECLELQKQVTKIESTLVDDKDAGEEIPPDFRLTLSASSGETEHLVTEAVIVATGIDMEIDVTIPMDTPYLFRIGSKRDDDWESGLWSGFKEIVKIYAALGGRDDLDLYRPKRH